MFSCLGKKTVVLRLDGKDSDKGYIQVDTKYGTILLIHVFSEFDGAEEDYLRKGFGRKLVGLAEEFLKERGFTTVRLQALVETWGFWEKVGYISATGDENYSKDI